MPRFSCLSYLLRIYCALEGGAEWAIFTQGRIWTPEQLCVTPLSNYLDLKLQIFITFQIISFQPQRPVLSHENIHSGGEPFQALYNYTPRNEDELELREGDVIDVMEKCDDGWFVGTSRRTKFFGTFPGNYVKRLWNFFFYLFMLHLCNTSA